MQLQTPEDVRQAVAARYKRHHRSWLAGGGAWPLSFGLGTPTELEFERSPEQLRQWVHAWASWQGAGRLVWEERQWARLGTQRLPRALVLDSAQDIARLVGDERRWSRAVQRYEQFITRWPQLIDRSSILGDFNVFADYSEADFARLVAALAWLLEH